jgi:hypothetical protein
MAMSNVPATRERRRLRHGGEGDMPTWFVGVDADVYVDGVLLSMLAKKGWGTKA